MKAAGLTHGGFYKHFESKDQLVAEACAEAVEAALASWGMEAQPTINAAVAAYLSTRHRDDPRSWRGSRRPRTPGVARWWRSRR
jgi:TetR/AcrR family transcriptional repressor of nem operon